MDSIIELLSEAENDEEKFILLEAAAQDPDFEPLNVKDIEKLFSLFPEDETVRVRVLNTICALGCKSDVTTAHIAAFFPDDYFDEVEALYQQRKKTRKRIRATIQKDGTIFMGLRKKKFIELLSNGIHTGYKRFFTRSVTCDGVIIRKSNEGYDVIDEDGLKQITETGRYLITTGRIFHSDNEEIQCKKARIPESQCSIDFRSEQRALVIRCTHLDMTYGCCQSTPLEYVTCIYCGKVATLNFSY